MPARTRKQVSPLPQLERALAALGEGELEDALDLLLQAWRLERAPRVAAAIDTLSLRVAEQHPAPHARTKARTLALWLEAGEDPEPADVGPLLDKFPCVLRGPAVEQQLQCLIAWPTDPRVAAAVARFLLATPDSLIYSKPLLWQRVFKVLGRHGDVRLVELLGPAETLPEEYPGYDALDSDVHTRTSRLLDGLRSSGTPRLSAAAGSVLASIERALERGRPDIEEQLGDLLAQIHERPDDLGLRQVYADRLLESGDPRGELINLQMLQKLTREQRGRIRQLLDQHRQRWLGALAPVLQDSKVRFAAGFPVSGALVENIKRDVVQAVIGDPAWSTFESLAVPTHCPFEETLSALLLHPALRSLTTVRGASAEVAARLFDSPRPLGIRSLSCNIRGDEEDQLRAMVNTGAGLPRLEELSAYSLNLDALWLLSSPATKRLGQLTLQCYDSSPVAALTTAIELRGGPQTLVLWTHTEHSYLPVGLTLTGRGPQKALAVTFREKSKTSPLFQIARWLEKLPKTSLRSLEIYLPKKTRVTARQLEVIRRATKRFKRVGRLELTETKWGPRVADG